MLAKGLALPREEIKPRLYAVGLAPRDIHALLRSAEQCPLDWRNRQLEFF
jgi:hypothetical protein